MTFLHPWFLAGLAGALVPILLHLFARRRIRSRPFSSVIFLTAIRRTAIRWARTTQHRLLAMRIGIIAVAALALARPSCGHPEAALTVIAVDGSASMGAGRGSIWRAARDAAIRLVNTCPGPVEVGVAREALHLRGSASPWELTSFVEELTPEGTTLDMRRVLDDAAAHAARAGSTLRLILVSDFQPSAWLDSLVTPPGVELWGVSIAGASGNLWLGPVAVSGAIRGEGMIEIDGTVGRSGVTEDSCRIILKSGGVEQELVLSLTGDENHFSFRMPRPRGTLLSASIVIDDLRGHAFDDRREAARWSAERCRVAILAPESETRSRMMAALDPDGTGRWGFDVCAPRFPEASGDSADVLVLLNAPRPDPWADAARMFRIRGMVLVADAEPLTSEGADLFRRAVGAAPEGVHGTTGPITFLDEHPVLAPFRRVPPRGFSPPRIDRFWSWRGGGNAILWMGNDALLIESARGPGRVLAFMTGMVPPWSDWASRASFVPLWQLAVDYASGSLTPQTVPFGTTFLAEIHWPGEGSATLRFPDHQNREVLPEAVHAGVARIRLGPFFAPGLHTLWKSGQPIALFEPVAPPEERTVGTPVRPGAVTRWIDASDSPWPPAGRDPGTSLLAGALALLIGEAWLALSFSRGAPSAGPAEAETP